MVSTLSIRNDGLVAEFFAPRGHDILPGLLVLGGSEGGLAYARRLGRRLAAEGYGVLCLAYFKAKGLPRLLEEIPLEYFQRALGWLDAHPRIDPGRIGVFGPSKGAEAALLIASQTDGLACVVAVAPSNVVWQSLNYRALRSRDWRAAARSSWSRDGAGLPFLAFEARGSRKTLTDMSNASLDRTDDVRRALIPVERIKVPVLLVSGGDDRLWPSRRMADDVAARIGAPQLCEHVCHPRAGHLVFPIFSRTSLILGALFRGHFGGDARADAAARPDCLRRTVAFFALHLQGR